MPAKIYTYPLTIKEAHLDTFGHVNNATYLKLYEEARWEVLTENGFGLQKLHSSGIGPTILEINIRFLKELRLREEIIIETQLISYTKKIGKIAQKMIRGQQVCSEMTLVIGLFDLKARKLIAPTEEWLHIWET